MKKRSESNRLLRGAKQQRAAHLFAKYSGFKTKDGKRRQKSSFDSPLREANCQRGIHMKEKYGGMETACKAISYLRRPAKSKLKLMQVRATAIIRARRAPPQNGTVMDITKTIAESWKEYERPSSILDTGYSGKNIITPHNADQAGLPRLGPSNKLIQDANGGISQASNKTRVSRPGLLPEASDGIIAPGVQHSMLPIRV